MTIGSGKTVNSDPLVIAAVDVYRYISLEIVQKFKIADLLEPGPQRQPMGCNSGLSPKHLMFYSFDRIECYGVRQT